MHKRHKGKKYFFLCAAFIAACFLTPLSTYGQTYRVYRPISRDFKTSKPLPTVFTHASLSLWTSLSLGKITDNHHKTISDKMAGYRLEALYEVLEGLYIGAEWSGQEGKDHSSFLKTFTQQQAGGIVKWVLTPQTEPQLYMMLSFGQIKNRAEFDLVSHETRHHTEYLSVGVGGKYRLFKGVKVGGEYRLKYQFSPLKTAFVEEKHPLRHEFSLGILAEF